MAAYTMPVQVLIDELGRLPGIGPKSAQRIAFHLLKVPTDDVARLAHALTDAKAKVRFCERCWNIADAVLCPICTDDRRDASTVCVVEEARDIVAIERTGEFRGRYHVLLGAMSPLEGIGPEQLKVKELFARIEPEGITEVILCTISSTPTSSPSAGRSRAGATCWPDPALADAVGRPRRVSASGRVVVRGGPPARGRW
jgi:recombination protein RecR